MKSEDNIAIVGGGPSGLLTAHYLRQRGYSKVYVLEKLGRIGGLCKTMTVGERSFDLGANYVVPSYKEIRKLAKKLDAELYSERPFVAMALPDDPDGKATTFSMFSAVTETPDGKPIPKLRFLWSLIRYVWIRFKLRKVLDNPTFKGVHTYENGALAESIATWLEKNRLQDLDRTFELPVTMMGYGHMKHSPAIYGLRFMTLKAFIPMVLKEVPVIGRLVPWPKRFTYGYQRFFERLSWDLDVRTDIDIESIERDEKKVVIRYTQPDQDLNHIVREEHTLEVDHLIFACPLRQFTEEGSPIQFDADETALFSQLDHTSYCMTTKDLDFGDTLKAPLAAIYPIPEYDDESPVPYGVAKQWTDSPFVQFYTQTKWPDDRSEEEIEEAVMRGVDRLARQMGGRDPEPGQTTSDTFNRWLYFQHVETEAIKAGWYDRLEAQQGKNRTYFVGGATNFELIEPIAEYAKHLVHKNFAKRPKPLRIARKTMMKAAAVALGLFAFGYCAFVPAPESIPIDYPVGAGAATAVSMDFWDTFQSNDREGIAPAPCEAGGPVADDGPILCRLLEAERADGTDETTPMLIAGLLLWRVQTGLYPEVAEDDLRTAAAFAQTAAERGNEYAPGFQGSAQWLLAVMTNDSGLGRSTAELFRLNTHEWPAFQAFIQMEQFSTRIGPDQNLEGATYSEAEDAFKYMLPACLLGNFTPPFMRMPPGTPINNFVNNALYFAVKIFGERVCYNNAPAPYSLPGTMVVAGDMYLKKGDLDTAISLYQNSLKSPRYTDWSYNNLPTDRLGNLAAYRERFLEDSGRVLGENQDMSMAGQSGFYCVMCHAHASAPH